MNWSWDASTSPDVVAYVLLIALLRQPAQPESWVEIAETSELSIAVDIPDPGLGECYLIDVEAIDAAGNISRGE